MSERIEPLQSLEDALKQGREATRSLCAAFDSLRESAARAYAACEQDATVQQGLRQRNEAMQRELELMRRECRE